MCFIILNDLYTAHHNLLSICHHLYGTLNFSTQCICMGTGSLLVYGFRGKARPLRRKNVFAIASIIAHHTGHSSNANWYTALVSIANCYIINPSRKYNWSFHHLSAMNFKVVSMINLVSPVLSSYLDVMVSYVHDDSTSTITSVN